MEKAILAITLIVAFVGLVGVLSSYDFTKATDALGSGITGNVIAVQSQQCGGCSGYSPVCAQRNHRLITYENACEASCDNAVVVAQMACERLPRIQ